jgi:DNA mismatch repair ATPase MutS
MKAHLMYPDRDFDLQRPLPWNAGALTQDLALDTLLHAMALEDPFLRSVGLAQLMMQCGLFVPAESFRSGLCDGVFTHYRREEDETMKSGKLDEELGRMSEIVDHLMTRPMVLFNESFAATNEREGSEIARQIVFALMGKRIRVFYVTHLFEFARDAYERNMEQTLFLRAERQADGGRTFRIVEGRPLHTSFGEDLYRGVFGTDA